MSEDRDGPVPAGFEPVPPLPGFAGVLQPIYWRRESENVSIGLVVAAQHGNTMGVCHGGVLMTLADITAATALNLGRGRAAVAPTVNLSVDFINGARIGQWIQADADLVVIKRRFGFCGGVITGPDNVVARFNGTFYFPDHGGMVREEAPGDGIPPLSKL